MKAPELPANEPARLDELRSYQILDTEPESVFDALTALVARILDVPIALVSLVDAERQWFKSRHGLAATETPRDVSFCGHAVASGVTLVVPDARLDSRFADNPLVSGDPLVRFYAGVPLRNARGFDLGTLCAIDHVPRHLKERELGVLSELAKVVVAQLETHRTFQVIRQVVNAVPAMLAYWDDQQRCRFANGAYEQWFGVRPEDLLGRTMQELLGPIYPLNLPYIEGALRGEEQSFERSIPDPKGGPTRHSQAHYVPHVEGGSVRGFAVMVSDISIRKKLEGELHQARSRAEALATHDGLTGLPNRRLLEERIGRALEHCKRFSRRCAVVFIDLDGFKAVNDSLGHAVGDEVLRHVARRLVESTRAADTVARLGGDEFVVLLPEVNGSEDVAAVAQKLLSVIRQHPITISGSDVGVGLSLGAAIFPDHAANASEVVARADEALYEAKRAGKNRFVLYSKA